MMFVMRAPQAKNSEHRFQHQVNIVGNISGANQTFCAKRANLPPDQHSWVCAGEVGGEICKSVIRADG